MITVSSGASQQDSGHWSTACISAPWASSWFTSCELAGRGEIDGWDAWFCVMLAMWLLLYWLHQSRCVDHNKLWKILKEMGIPDYLTCLLRNLYTGQEATVRTGHGTTDWFQIGKGVQQGCVLSPCLLNIWEYIMRNARLDEAQAGIKFAKRNLNNLRYADDTTLMAESEEELKSLLIKVKEESESWLKTQHSKNKDHGICSHHFMGNRWGNNGNRNRGRLFCRGGLQNHCRWWLQPWN